MVIFLLKINFVLITNKTSKGEQKQKYVGQSFTSYALPYCRHHFFFSNFLKTHCILVTMEDDLLTAVTAKEFPVVAPLPSLTNRLSIADFQKISPTR